jgi:hypothetical protein
LLQLLAPLHYRGDTGYYVRQLIYSCALRPF